MRKIGYKFLIIPDCFEINIRFYDLNVNNFDYKQKTFTKASMLQILFFQRSSGGLR